MWGKLWAQEQVMHANRLFAPPESTGVINLSQQLTPDVVSWLGSGIQECTSVGETMTAVLPGLMHIAILLFMIGLVVFVWEISVTLSCVLLVFIVVGAIAYFVFARIRGVKWYHFLLVRAAVRWILLRHRV
jgi:hypothetical protein